MTNLIFDYSKLKGLIIEKYGSLKAFATAIHTSPANVSMRITSGKPFRADVMTEWAEALELDVSEWGSYFFRVKS